MGVTCDFIAVSTFYGNVIAIYVFTATNEIEPSNQTSGANIFVFS